MKCRLHKWSTVVGTPSVIHLYGSKKPISGDDAERLDPYQHNEMVTVNEHEKGYFMYVLTHLKIFLISMTTLLILIFTFGISVTR